MPATVKYAVLYTDPVVIISRADGTSLTWWCADGKTWEQPAPSEWIMNAPVITKEAFEAMFDTLPPYPPEMLAQIEGSSARATA